VLSQGGGKERHLAVFPTRLQAHQLKNKASLDFPVSVPAKTRVIPGLYVFDDFITESEERGIVEALDQRPWVKMLQRRVQHFGYEFVYGANNVDQSKKISDMPDFLDFLLPRISEQLSHFTFEKRDELHDEEAFYNEHVVPPGLPTASSRYADATTGFCFDQLTVNDYQPGQGIPPHVDTHSPFEEVFVSLSLGSGVSMNFRRPDAPYQQDVYLLPRQLVVFTGEARYNYLHSISTRKVDKAEGFLRFRRRRISLTFRKLRTSGEPCRCRYPLLCDSQSGGAS
jgi:alkylated DNA repair protein alkB family protein 8